VRQKIIEYFEIPNHGTVVVVPEPTHMPARRVLKVSIIGSDGSRLAAEATKEWLLRRTIELIEQEAYLLRGVSKSQLPKEGFIEIEEG